MKKNIFKKVLAGVAAFAMVATMMPATTAQAANGDTTIKFNFPVEPTFEVYEAADLTGTALNGDRSLSNDGGISAAYTFYVAPAKGYVYRSKPDIKVEVGGAPVTASIDENTDNRVGTWTVAIAKGALNAGVAANEVDVTIPEASAVTFNVNVTRGDDVLVTSSAATTMPTEATNMPTVKYPFAMNDDGSTGTKHWTATLKDGSAGYAGVFQKNQKTQLLNSYYGAAVTTAVTDESLTAKTPAHVAIDLDAWWTAYETAGYDSKLENIDFHFGAKLDTYYVVLGAPDAHTSDATTTVLDAQWAWHNDKDREFAGKDAIVSTVSNHSSKVNDLIFKQSDGDTFKFMVNVDPAYDDSEMEVTATGLATGGMYTADGADYTAGAKSTTLEATDGVYELEVDDNYIIEVNGLIEKDVNDVIFTGLIPDGETATVVTYNLQTGDVVKTDKTLTPAKAGTTAGWTTVEALPDGEYIFKVELGTGYVKGANFKVTANGEALTEGDDGSYTLKVDGEDVTVAVEGVEKGATVIRPTPSGYTFEFDEATKAYVDKESTALQTDVPVGFVYRFKVVLDEGYSKGPSFRVETVPTTTRDGDKGVVIQENNGYYEIRVTEAGGTIRFGVYDIIRDEGNRFIDVTSPACSDEAIAAINWAAENGIVNGRTTNTFVPKGTATRAEFVTMMHRYAKNEAAASTDTAFTDINGHWANASIVWAEKHDPFLTNGLTATTFGPDATITRAQTLTILHRFANKPAATVTNPFTDATADWYKDAILWAVDKNITKGISATEFGPDNNVTREQIAVFLYRAANAGALDAASADDASSDSSTSDSSSEASTETTAE